VLSTSLSLKFIHAFVGRIKNGASKQPAGIEAPRYAAQHVARVLYQGRYSITENFLLLTYCKATEPLVRSVAVHGIEEAASHS